MASRGRVNRSRRSSLLLAADVDSAKAPAKRARGRPNEGRQRLLDTAERLFGEHGVDAISVRQITLAAGQSNNSAVAHHFGSKEDLLLAIFKNRSLEVDSAVRSTEARRVGNECVSTYRYRWWAEHKK